MTDISQALQDAYRATHYRVLAPQAFTLRIGTKSDALLDLYQSSGAREAAFLTAWNPLSVTASAEQNRSAQALLVERLVSMGVAALPGLGINPASEHPGEESLLALGLPRDAAISLAQDFRQNALVWIGPDAIPELILLQ
jgi:hypothetical protein